MTIHLDLSPEVEAQLAVAAETRGIALERYASTLIEDALTPPARGSGKLTIEEFRAMLNELAEGSEDLPSLPTEGFTRESFYEDRT